MTDFIEEPTPVTRTLVPEDQRLPVTAELFGTHFPLRLEPVKYGITKRMAQDYLGGYWLMYTLDNGVSTWRPRGMQSTKSAPTTISLENCLLMAWGPQHAFVHNANCHF